MNKYKKKKKEKEKKRKKYDNRKIMIKILEKALDLKQ